MSRSSVRKSGRLKTRKKSNNKSNDFEYDENKFDPEDDSNMEIQTKSNVDISTNISDLLQSHSKDVGDDLAHLDPTAFPNVLLRFQSEDIPGADMYNESNPTSSAQILSCDICGKMLADISSYDKHMKTHSSERQFHCGQCEKSFHDNCSLSRHMKIHQDDKPFSCEICQKSFRFAASISRHMLTHTERPRTFQCSLCDKSFTDKCGLKRHERTHTGVRPFVCGVCQKAFIDSCSFKRHQKIHIGIKNFHCAACNRSFMEKQSLIRHQKTACKLLGEMSDPKQDKIINNNELSNQNDDSNPTDNQKSSQLSLPNDRGKGQPNHCASNSHNNKSNNSLSEPMLMSYDSTNSPSTLSSDNDLVNSIVLQESKSIIKGQPSLGSLIQKDPGLYDSISEIVESIDSYEKMLDLCGDQGQKEIDAALTRDPVIAMPNNLLCFECGELLVDGGNFKSEGKLFHPSMTNAFKCLNCEAAEDGVDNEYEEPPVLMPHFEAEDNFVQSGASEDDIGSSFPSENCKETENFYGTNEPMDAFQDRLKKEHGVLFFQNSDSFLRNNNDEDNIKVQNDDDSISQYFANNEQSNIYSTPVPSKSNRKSRKRCVKSDTIHPDRIEELEEGNQSIIEYEADDPTIPSVFPCHLCTKVFASAPFLAQHLSLHKNSPHKCMVCTKSFTSGPALKRHTRLHTGEKPYICPICQKKFRDPSNFGKHKKYCIKQIGSESVLNYGSPLCSDVNDLTKLSVLEVGDLTPMVKSEVEESIYDGDGQQNGEVTFLDNSAPTGIVDENMVIDPVGDEIDEIPAGLIKQEVENEGYPVMTVIPFLDDEDEIAEANQKCPSNNAVSSEKYVQRVSTYEESKDINDDSGEKQKRYVSCKVCQKLCENDDHLEMHMNYHTGNPNITCIECGKIFADSFGMKRHMRTHLGVRPFTCEYCKRGYCDNWSLKKHKSKGCVKTEVKVPVDLLHPCPKCIKVFSDEGDLQVHMKMHKGLTPMKYECDVCHKRFAEAFNLKKHRRLHMAICPGCGQEFKNIQLLTTHRETDCSASLITDDSNTVNEEKSYSCDICGRTYSTKAYLDRHRKIHSDVKPHVCEICNKRFAEAFKLRRHKKASHSDEKPFICQDCGKCFSDDAALKRHAVSSSCALSKVMGGSVDSETCACQFCDKVFPKSYMLVRHMTVHSQNRPFACDLCGRSYKDTSSLKRHQMIHQGVKDFICPNCGADFYYSDSLKRHMSGRCGKKSKTRRRKAASWNRPKKRNPNKSIPTINDLQVPTDIGVSDLANVPRPKMHTSPYVPNTILESSPFVSVPSTKKLKQSTDVGKWSCHFNKHCWLCDSKARSVSALNAHRRRVHQSNSKRFSCPKCFFRFDKKIYWRAHSLSCHKKILSVDHKTNNNVKIKATRRRTIQTLNDAFPPSTDIVDGYEIVSKDARDGKRPRRSVPRAKWSWISQI